MTVRWEPSERSLVTLDFFFFSPDRLPSSAELLTQVSPIAWQHINFYGRYEFTKGPTPINLDAIVEELAQRPIVLTPEES